MRSKVQTCASLTAVPVNSGVHRQLKQLMDAKMNAECALQILQFIGGNISGGVCDELKSDAARLGLDVIFTIE